MKANLFSKLLLFSLFGIALYFFGILYEGLVYGPKLLDTTMERMLFWKNFTSIISPIVYYIPWVYLATIVLMVLYFKTPVERTELKNNLRWAVVSQIISLALTIYILSGINFKMSFGNLEKYANAIPGKVMLFNMLSVLRLVFGGLSLSNTFRAYSQTLNN